MGNTLGKASQHISDQFLSCGNRRKKKLSKLSNGGLQSSGTSPGADSSVSSVANNLASWTKQGESVSLISHSTSQAAAAAEVKEYQSPKEAVDFKKDNELLNVQHCSKIMATSEHILEKTLLPFQQEPSSNSKPVVQIFQEKEMELNKSMVEEDPCIIMKAFDRNNSNNNGGNENSNGSCIGNDVIQEKTQEKNVGEQRLDESVENLDKNGKAVLKSKQVNGIRLCKIV